VSWDKRSIATKSISLRLQTPLGEEEGFLTNRGEKEQLRCVRGDRPLNREACSIIGEWGSSGIEKRRETKTLFAVVAKTEMRMQRNQSGGKYLLLRLQLNSVRTESAKERKEASGRTIPGQGKKKS